jgi:AraC-like DNA-binding protein
MASATSDRIYFNTDALPERDRFPAVREEFARQLLRVDCTNRSEIPFAARFNISRVGHLALAYIDTSAADYVRTPELIRDGEEYFFATFNFNGVMHCSQPEVGRPIRSGEAVVLDSTHVGGVHFNDYCSYLTLRIPRSDLAHVLPDATKFAGMRLDHTLTASRLLFGYLDATRDIQFGAPGRVAELFDQHILDLIALALGVSGEARTIAEDRGLRQARRGEVLSEITRRSGDAGLNAIGVAGLLGITPRYVHLLLEETGKSFTHHVLERRLERAAALLRDPNLRHRKIADVAAEAGFTDLSYFNRAFRRHYGATPSDIREAARRDD